MNRPKRVSSIKGDFAYKNYLAFKRTTGIIDVDSKSFKGFNKTGVYTSSKFHHSVFVLVYDGIVYIFNPNYHKDYDSYPEYDGFKRFRGSNIVRVWINRSDDLHRGVLRSAGLDGSDGVCSVFAFELKKTFKKAPIISAWIDFVSRMNIQQAMRLFRGQLL